MNLRPTPTWSTETAPVTTRILEIGLDGESLFRYETLSLSDAVLSPLTSSMIAPGASYLHEEFNIEDSYLGAFAVSSFMIGYVSGPLIIAPLSELCGRFWLYKICSVIFLIFNIACGFSRNTTTLIICHMFAGIGGSCPLTLAAATLADMVSPSKRGFRMMFITLGPMIGPTIGPIAGGYIIQAAAWRCAFWELAIMTEKQNVFEKRQKTPNFASYLATNRTLKDLFISAIFRPVKLMFLSPLVYLLSLYMAILHGYLYLLFTTFLDVFETQYAFSKGSVA
ncbi:fluconazole resistance protein [Seiridium cupressi]